MGVPVLEFGATRPPALILAVYRHVKPYRTPGTPFKTSDFSLTRLYYSTEGRYIMRVFSLPNSAAKFGFVVGRLVRQVSDGSDLDTLPEAIGVSGKVLFTPLQRFSKENDYSAFLFRDVFEVSLNDDGSLIDPNELVGVYLPTGLYKVTFKLDSGRLPGFNIQVLESHTETNPLDLVAAAPFIPDPAQTVTVARIPQGTPGQVLGYSLAGELVALDRIVMSLAEREKLFNIEPFATKNASDEALRDRATHTGTQLSETIADSSPLGRNILSAQSADDIKSLLSIGAGGGSVDVQVYIPQGPPSSETNYTWVKPANAKSVYIMCVGGGGGGGSGRRGAMGVVSCGGGGGSAGLASELTTAAIFLPDTLTVAVGQYGAGGAAVTTDATNGNNGSGGGMSSIFLESKSVLSAYAGNGGGGGTTTSGSAGNANTTGTLADSNRAPKGAAASTWGGPGNNSNYVDAGICSTGGGSGGGITSAGVPSSGGYGHTADATFSALGYGGAAGGGDGSTYSAYLTGPGGGGGGSSVNSRGGNGGNGGGWGAGGGGGGASLNGYLSGAGGNGAPGIVIIVTYC